MKLKSLQENRILFDQESKKIEEEKMSYVANHLNRMIGACTDKQLILEIEAMYYLAFVCSRYCEIKDNSSIKVGLDIETVLSVLKDSNYVWRRETRISEDRRILKLIIIDLE